MAVSAPAPLADAPMPPPSPKRSTAAPMPPASAPPPEPMRARSAPTASIAAMLSGAGGAAPAKPAQPPDLPGPLEVSADLLDYPALRMAPWHSPDRGRLRPAKLATLASEASLPAEAADRLGEARGQRDEAAARLARLALPPHTPAEGPAEGAWHQLELPDRARVPSDGAWHPLGAGEEELSIELRYRAIPRLDARAFRRVTARRTQTAPLLPGPLDVLIDGALQRTLPWAGAGRGHELRLELGVEDHLRVARNVHYTEDSVGIFGGERRLHTHIKVEVASALSRDAVVELIDRLPVADEDGLSVVLAASEPKAEPWAGEVEQSPLEGARLQTLTVKAGGQASASLHYHVTLPTRRELVGGDRRG